jgi:hypothetical protein
MKINKRLTRFSCQFAAIAIVLATFVAWDTHTTHEIKWEKASLDDHNVMRAPELIIQHQDKDEIWATIGYSIYWSRQGENFKKVITIRPRFGLAWAGFSRVLRSWSGYNELMEVVPLSPRFLAVFAAGDIYRVDLRAKSQDQVHQLRYFGLEQGRGVMPHGIAVDAQGSLYYGEYTTSRLDSNHTIRLYRSDDEARTWKVVFEFKPAQVRHIHAVRWDPISNTIWVGTGDLDSQSRIGYSHDSGKSFQWIGMGSQLFRVVSMLFFDDVVVWGTDTTEKEAMRTVLWCRTEDCIDVGGKTLPAPAYYALKLGKNAGIITLAETKTSVWYIDSQNYVRKLFEWPTDTEHRGPHPAVRVPRGSGMGSQWVYLNPLRTTEQGVAIYKIPVSLLLH